MLSLSRALPDARLELGFGDIERLTVREVIDQLEGKRTVPEPVTAVEAVTVSEPELGPTPAPDLARSALRHARTATARRLAGSS